MLRAQLYIAVPPLAGVITPRWDLQARGMRWGMGGDVTPPPRRRSQGFFRVWVEPGATASLSFAVSAAQLTTVLTNGTRVRSPGRYIAWVGGHQPDDPLGVSNVVNGTFVL